MSRQSERSNEPMIERVEYVHDLKQWLYNKNAPVPGAALAPLRLPGLRAFWSASAFTKTGQVSDLTGAANHLYIYEPPGAACTIGTEWPGVIAPELFVTEGANGVLNICTAGGNTAVTDITGALTFGCWWKLATLTDDQHIMWWMDWLNNLRCTMRYLADEETYEFTLSDDGVAFVSLTYCEEIPAVDVWHFNVSRFIPSTEMMLRDNGSQKTLTDGIPSSIFPSDYFCIYPYKMNTLGGCPHLAQAWVCASAVPDTNIEWLYQVQRPLFGKT